MTDACYPLVTNALLRVDNVSEPAPPPFEHIEIDGYGDIWVYEFGIDTPLDEWSLSAIPDLDRLAPILKDFPGTNKYLFIRTERNLSKSSSHVVRFPLALAKSALSCGAEIEHSTYHSHL